MMQIVPFEAAHLQAIEVQGHQALVRPLLDSPDYIAALKSGPAYTALEGETVHACAGLIVHWPGRAHAWTILAGKLNRRMLLIHRAIMGYLVECPIARIEAAVECDFPEGHRWMRLLGFVCEAPRMEHYMPDGSAAALYARVKAN